MTNVLGVEGRRIESVLFTHAQLPLCVWVHVCGPLGHCLSVCVRPCLCLYCPLLGAVLNAGYKFYHYQRWIINSYAWWICVNLPNAHTHNPHRQPGWHTHTDRHTHVCMCITICCLNAAFIAYFCAYVFTGLHTKILACVPTNCNYVQPVQHILQTKQKKRKEKGKIYWKGKCNALERLSLSPGSEVPTRHFR